MNGTPLFPGGPGNVREHLRGVCEAAADSLNVIRDEIATACIGLADLELPALVTLEIIDALLPNAVRMAAKWELITAAKHFHERRARLD